MTTENQTQETQKTKVQSDLAPNIKSVTIPPNWLKNRINPTKGYIEWFNELTEKVKEKYNHNLNN